MKEYISVKGAKEHNLKNIDVMIPRNKMVVITGLSGSGKSSLAFDTIYAEGQRRYVESLSAYARQFLGQMDKPDVESIEGLSPAISIDQKTTSRNPRSTVGTVTEIHDYLRLLYARIGTPHCPVCHKPIESQSVDQIVDFIMEEQEGTKLIIYSPVIRGRKGEHEKVLERIKKEGFTRVRIDGETYRLDEDEIKLDKNFKHDIDIVVDRVVVKEGQESRLADGVEIAITNGDGLVKIETLGENAKTTTYSTKLACQEHGIALEELEPRMFSFNSPYGACSSCNGLGYKESLDIDVAIDHERSISDGALEDMIKILEYGSYYRRCIEGIMREYQCDFQMPFGKLPKKVRNEILYGRNKKVTIIHQLRNGDIREETLAYGGIVSPIERKYRETESDIVKDRLKKYMTLEQCNKCKGKRLKDEVLAVTVGELNIAELSDLSIKNCLQYIENLQLTENQQIIGQQILKEIKERLGFLINVGLDYLTLSRQAMTLSGGESQRIRLATQIGSSLMGVLYILDEPSIGLHQRDNDRLLATLRKMTEMGNTLLVVEHDEDTMREADHIIDIGPGAGKWGGNLVAEGTIDEICQVEESLTGQYLSGKAKIPVPPTRRKGNGQRISIKGAKQNNLKNVDVDIPLGKLVCVTGVSGSGKSTLINEILYKAGQSHLNGNIKELTGCKSVKGFEHIDKIIDIDQTPIGRSPRSNPATYTGMFTPIRDLFATLPEAKKRGYNKGRFSFNVKGGRCEACSGDGIIKIEMHFLSDVYVPCEVCKGHRYNRETLEVKYKGKNIYDVLNMSVGEAKEFFNNIPAITRQLDTLSKVGLDYITIGQSSTQLSGGEAQRIKLASELSKRSTGKTLYILDEPTTGLHFADVAKLIDVLQQLVDAGNTVVVIEHNLDVIKCADHIIDLGPEGGDGGGEILITGTPEEVAAFDKSYTGQFLKKML